MKELIDKYLPSQFILLEKRQYRVVFEYFEPVLLAYASENITDTMKLISRYFPEAYADFKMMALAVEHPRYLHLSDDVSRLISLAFFLFRCQLVAADPEMSDVLNPRLQANACAFFKIEIENLITTIHSELKVSKSY